MLKVTKIPKKKNEHNQKQQTNLQAKENGKRREENKNETL